jgi:N-acetylglucosamine repressor
MSLQEQPGMRHVPTMRERHKAVLLDVIRRLGPLSRVEIHDLTSLRPATITLLVRELLKESKVIEVGRSDNPMGRKQVLLRLNEQAGFIVGVDFDAEYVSAACMDLHPRVLKNVIRESTFVDGGADALIQQLFACTQKAIEVCGLSRRKLLGIGIGDPGIVDTRAGLSVLCSTIEFWREIPIMELFQKRFGVPVVLGNSTRTKTTAERILGAGDGARDMIYIEYGKGIGAGIIVDGKVLEGHNWAAGEFGHTHVTENGPPCKCGSFGCLEAIAGLTALESRIRSALRDGGSSRALDAVNGDIARISGWTVLQAAAAGDKMCVAILEGLGRHLGLGIANLVNLFNPSLIVLDERLELAGNELLQQITRVVIRQALGNSTRCLVFRFGKLGSEAGVLGAGLLVLERLFDVPVLKPPRFMLDGSETAFASKRKARVRAMDQKLSGSVSAGS